MSTFVAPPGIRVVRPLARDAHAELLLVHIDDGERSGPAAVARALDETGAHGRRIELAALDRGRGPGVVELLDVLEDEAAPALLLAHAPGPTLAEVCTAREHWAAGEAVTILGPLAGALRRLHDAGVGHGSFGASRIVLTPEGPALVGFARAELFAAGAPEVARVRVDGVLRDREALRGLALELLGAVTGPRSEAARELAGRVAMAGGAELCALLEEGTAQLAAGVAVRREDAAEPSPPAEERTVVATAGDAGVPPSTGALARLIGPVRALLPDLDRLLPLRERLDALPPLRRRLVVGGASAVAVAAVLLAVMPGEGPRGPTTGGAVASGTASDGGAPSADASGAPEGAADAAARAAIEGDDPLAAASALLALREHCLRELSLLCLELVDQPGSAALADDRAAIQAIRSGAETVPMSAVPGAVPRLVERLGDSAIVELGPETAPASLLLMRGEAGWRIRDWVAAVG